MKTIGSLNMDCDNCEIAEHCGPVWSDVEICTQWRFEDITVELFEEAIKEVDKEDRRREGIDFAHEIIQEW